MGSRGRIRGTSYWQVAYFRDASNNNLLKLVSDRKLIVPAGHGVP